MASAIERAIAENRSRLSDGDAALRQQMVELYLSTYLSIEADLVALSDRIEEARAAGVDVHPDWVRRQVRYQQLLSNIEREFARFETSAAQLLEGAQRTFAEAGATDAVSLTKLADAGAVTMSSGAINTIA